MNAGIRKMHAGIQKPNAGTCRAMCSLMCCACVLLRVRATTTVRAARTYVSKLGFGIPAHTVPQVQTQKVVAKCASVRRNKVSASPTRYELCCPSCPSLAPLRSRYIFITVCSFSGLALHRTNLFSLLATTLTPSSLLATVLRDEVKRGMRFRWNHIKYLIR